MSPRAIDKRARPGNEDHRTTVPPGDLTALEEATAADPKQSAELEPADSAQQG
ncbi:hypothetical protein ACGFIF_35720 [Kribbella sp. NPDC049174]|uniref:hypothetical protein n=1 Tax=Kribbella sp. NPDC049174 TaxID=3364112 RepID=UPI00371E3B5E